MRYFKFFAVFAVAAALLCAGSVAPAQIGIGVNIGPAPICP
jgi:hypothetical protein